MKLSGWKRQTGAAMAMPMILAKLAEQFLGVDTGDVDKWLMILAMVGGPLWGLGWVDKVLPFTVQLEKLLEAFNAWAKKRGGQAGEVTVKGVVTTVVAGVLIAGGVITDFDPPADVELPNSKTVEAKQISGRYVSVASLNRTEKVNPDSSVTVTLDTVRVDTVYAPARAKPFNKEIAKGEVVRVYVQRGDSVVWQSVVSDSLFPLYCKVKVETAVVEPVVEEKELEEVIR